MIKPIIEFQTNQQTRNSSASLASRIPALIADRRYPHQFLELFSFTELAWVSRHPSVLVSTTYQLKTSLSCDEYRYLTICPDRWSDVVPDPG